MSDPIAGGGAALVAEEMLKEVEAAAQQAEQLAQAPETPGVEFTQVLETQRVTEVSEARLSRADVLRAAREANVMPRLPAISQEVSKNSWSTGIQRIMEDVMQGQNKLEEIMGLALSGRNFSTHELLAMQAGVYRFTQELELTSKVVEKSTATIKQMMNTQV